MKYSLKLAS